MSALASVWRSLWRFHRLLAGILVLEYALAFAIVLTAFSVLIARSTAIDETSGVDENGLYVLEGRGVQEPLHRFQLMGAMQRFQAVAGRKHVALGSSVPFFGRGALVMPIRVHHPARQSTPLPVIGYEAGIHFANVLGLRILHGRGFQPDEVAHRFGDATNVVLLSAPLARRLFHGSTAVGRLVELAGHMHTVVGVVNPLSAPSYLGDQSTQYTFVLPKVAGNHNLVLIRYDGPRAELNAAYAALRKHDADKVNWSLWSYAELRSAYFRSDRLAVRALAVVVIVVMITALCGILGLTNYWISNCRPQIAIRRALGARKRDITRHYLGESGLLVVIGLVLGVMLNFFFSGYLGVVPFEGGATVWLFAIVLVLFLVVIVIHASLRRWLRMDPAELMRAL